MSQVKTMVVEVWVIVDSEENYAVGTDEDGACTHYSEDIDADNAYPTRRVKVLLTIPVPTVPTLTGVVPADGDATLSVAGV